MPRVRPIRRSASLGSARADLVPAWQTRLDDHVIAAQASPDGTLVAAASVSGPISLIDATTGGTVHALAGHSAGTSAIDWHLDQLTLASAGQDGCVRLWDATSGEETAVLDAGGSWVERVRWSPAAGLLAAAAGRRITLWRPDGVVLAEWTDHPSTVTDIGWSPDGSLLAATTYGGVTLWAAESPDPVRLEWTGSSLALAWSPTGRHLATGDQDATVHFWLVSRRSDLQMSGYPTKVRELAWDASGRYLATGGGSDVTVWDCAPPGPAGSRPMIADGDDSLVTVLAAQHRGGLIAAGSAKGRVFLFRALAAAGRGRIDLGVGVSALTWYPDDRHLIVGSDTGGITCLELG